MIAAVADLDPPQSPASSGVLAGPGGPAAVSEPVTPEEFFRADIRVGLVVRAEENAKARKPAYKLWIDFGELGIRTSSAQLTDLYQAADLTGTLVLAVVNFPPRKVAGFSSEVLVLGVPADGGEAVALVGPDRPVAPGTRVF
jgi:tRNA-binding protein